MNVITQPQICFKDKTLQSRHGIGRARESRVRAKAGPRPYVREKLPRRTLLLGIGAIPSIPDGLQSTPPVQGIF